MPRPDGSWRRWLMMNRHAVAICSILQLFCSRKMFFELSFCILAWKASVNVLLVRMCPRQVEKIWLCPPFPFRWVFCTLRSGIHERNLRFSEYIPSCFNLSSYVNFFFASSHPLASLWSRTPKIQVGGLGSAVSSPSGVWSGAPTEIELVH